MSDNQLADIAGTFSSDLVNVYGGSAGNLIAYLPGGIPVPDYFVQDGAVNVLQVTEWLRANFDTPVLVRPGDVTISDHSPGYASELYGMAVSGARPLGEQGSDELSEVAGLLALAKKQYGDPGAQRPIGCTPMDWPVATNDAYWTSFNSAKATSSSTTTTTTTIAPGDPPPADPQPDPPATSPEVVLPIRPDLWRLREIVPPVEPPPEVDAPPVVTNRITDELRFQPAIATAVETRIQPPVETSVETAVEPMILNRAVLRDVQMARPLLATASLTQVARRRVSLDRIDVSLLQQARVVEDVTTTSDSSSLSITLDHTRVTLSRSLGGVSWWDEAFLEDGRWYLPGLPAGSKLPPPPPPAPEDTGDPHVYALPVGLVLVRNLAVAGTWSADASEVLSSSGGLLGPFNLAGASITHDADGTTTYGCPGMQVVAILYAPLPVVPPADDPASAPTG